MKEYNELNQILADLRMDDRVQEMRKYTQHGNVTTYEHCEDVARLCCKLNRALPLHADLKTLLVGAMLHDFYLYDWHEKGDGTHRLHGYSHAERACRNAKEYFDIDDETWHIIYCHMWPLNLTRIPRTREAWMVCLADKYISVRETLFKRSRGSR